MYIGGSGYGKSGLGKMLTIFVEYKYLNLFVVRIKREGTRCAEVVRDRELSEFVVRLLKTSLSSSQHKPGAGVPTQQFHSSV